MHALEEGRKIDRLYSEKFKFERFLKVEQELYERNMFAIDSFFIIILHNFPFHIHVCVCVYVSDELNTTCLVTHFLLNVNFIKYL